MGAERHNERGEALREAEAAAAAQRRRAAERAAKHRQARALEVRRGLRQFLRCVHPDLFSSDGGTGKQSSSVRSGDGGCGGQQGESSSSSGGRSVAELVAHAQEQNQRSLQQLNAFLDTANLLLNAEGSSSASSTSSSPAASLPPTDTPAEALPNVRVVDQLPASLMLRFYLREDVTDANAVAAATMDHTPAHTTAPSGLRARAGRSAQERTSALHKAHGHSSGRSSSHSGGGSGGLAHFEQCTLTGYHVLVLEVEVPRRIPQSLRRALAEKRPLRALSRARPPLEALVNRCVYALLTGAGVQAPAWLLDSVSGEHVGGEHAGDGRGDRYRPPRRESASAELRDKVDEFLKVNDPAAAVHPGKDHETVERYRELYPLDNNRVFVDHRLTLEQGKRAVATLLSHLPKLGFPSWAELPIFLQASENALAHAALAMSSSSSSSSPAKSSSSVDRDSAQGRSSGSSLQGEGREEEKEEEESIQESMLHDGGARADEVKSDASSLVTAHTTAQLEATRRSMPGFVVLPCDGTLEQWQQVLSEQVAEVQEHYERERTQIEYAVDITTQLCRDLSVGGLGVNSSNSGVRAFVCVLLVVLISLVSSFFVPFFCVSWSLLS
jgi:hypothetical protein